MAELNIHDVKLLPLKQISDERGAVFHYLRCENSEFKGFGEAYFSKINEGVIKGWKYHHKIHQNFCVPFGSVRIVMYDGRENSPSFGLFSEIVLDDSQHYALLSLPPGIWYSFKCISKDFALLSNIIDSAHEPAESETLPLINNTIPYDWR